VGDGGGGRGLQKKKKFGKKKKKKKSMARCWNREQLHDTKKKRENTGSEGRRWLHRSRAKSRVPRKKKRAVAQRGGSGGVDWVVRGCVHGETRGRIKGKGKWRNVEEEGDSIMRGDLLQ